MATLALTLALALSLIQPLATQNYCLHQLGCFRYTCADFTKDAVIILRHDGFNAYPMCGGFHAWVGMDLDGKHFDIEPQTDSLANYQGHRCVVRGLA